jgi:uncharacterized membrane protein
MKSSAIIIATFIFVVGSIVCGATIIPLMNQPPILSVLCGFVCVLLFFYVKGKRKHKSKRTLRFIPIELERVED